MRALIELGAHVNKARDDGGTPLFIAAEVGHEAVVRALMELGVHINKARDIGVMPLYIGAQKGHEAVVRALIKLGACVNKATNNGWTPLSIAAGMGHTAIVQILNDAVLVPMARFFVNTRRTILYTLITLDIINLRRRPPPCARKTKKSHRKPTRNQVSFVLPNGRSQSFFSPA